MVMIRIMSLLGELSCWQSICETLGKNTSRKGERLLVNVDDLTPLSVESFCWQLIREKLRKKVQRESKRRCL